VDEFEIADDNLTGKEVVRKTRSGIPDDHRASNDSRLQWLWMQKLVTVQSIANRSPDIQDVMAAQLILSAVMAGYLPSLELLLQRLEGGAVTDEAIVEQGSMVV
jgi:hypothetical protein